MLSNVLSAIAMGLLFVMMVLGAADVIGRYFFNKPIIGTMETGQVLLALIVVFGWSYTHIAKAHINVELLVSRLRPRARAVANFITNFMALVLFSLIVWQAAVTANMYHEAGRFIYTIEWPLAPFQLLVSLGALALCLVFILELVHLLLQIKSGG